MGFLRDESGSSLGLGLFSLGLCAYSRNVDAALGMAATYTPTLTFAGVGNVSPGASMDATYTPSLIMAFSGDVYVTGTMDADYTPTLTFAGNAGGLIEGSMAPTYTPSLTFAGVGSIAATNPVVSSDSYSPGSGGTAATLNISGSYAGAGDMDLYGVTGTATITVTEAQLEAGSGGTNTIEFFSVADFTFGSSFSVSGLTSSSEAANSIKYVVVERGTAGTSGVQTISVSGLDFTDPAFSSAEVGNVDNDTVRVTFNSALYGTVDYTDFTLTGNTITAASLTPGNAYVDLTLGTTATGSDDYTGDLSYDGTGSAMTDASGNTADTFTSQNVTNNVSSWTPASDGSLVHNWDASDTGSITGSPTVTAIADQVGSVSLAASGNPQTGATTRNSLNVIDMDGTGDWLSGTVSDFHSSGNVLLTAVLNYNDTTGGVLVTDATSGSEDWHLENDDMSMVAINESSESPTAATNQPFTGWHVIQVVASQGNFLRVHIDGALEVDMAYDIGTFTASQVFSILGGKFASFEAAGSFAEAWISHDLAQQANYATYAASKWGF